MPKYIVIEIGNAVITEGLFNKGNNVLEYEETEDGVFLGEVIAGNPIEAELVIKKQQPNREFDTLKIYEVN